MTVVLRQNDTRTASGVDPSSHNRLPNEPCFALNLGASKNIDLRPSCLYVSCQSFLAGSGAAPRGLAVTVETRDLTRSRAGNMPTFKSHKRSYTHSLVSSGPASVTQHARDLRDHVRPHVIGGAEQCRDVVMCPAETGSPHQSRDPLRHRVVNDLS